MVGERKREREGEREDERQKTAGTYIDNTGNT